METIELRKTVLAIRQKLWELEDSIPEKLLKEHSIDKDIMEITTLLSNLSVKLMKIR